MIVSVTNMMRFRQSFWLDFVNNNCSQNGIWKRQTTWCPHILTNTRWTNAYQSSNWASSASRRRCHPAPTLCPSVSCRRRVRWSACTAQPAPACCCSSSPPTCGWRAWCSASACWASTSLCEPHHPQHTRTEPSRTAWCDWFFFCFLFFFANVTRLLLNRFGIVFIQPWIICLNVSPNCEKHEYLHKYLHIF